MDEEEYRLAVIRVGKAFKELPNLRAQVNVLASLIMFIKDRPKKKLVRDWLDEAEGQLRGSVMLLSGDPEEDGEKV